MASEMSFKTPKYHNSISQDKTKEFRCLFSTIRRTSRSTMEENIYGFLIFYAANKKDIDGKVACKLIFSKLPRVCFKEHIMDSDLVAFLLKTIHSLRPTLIPHLVLFLSVLCLTHKTLPPETLLKRNELKKCSFSAITYFLHHAYRKRLTVRDQRLTDLIVNVNSKPYAKLILFGNLRSVRSLIQFGLRFELPGKKASRIHPIFIQAAEFLSWFIKKTRLWRQNTSKKANRKKKYLKKMLSFAQNLKLLLVSTSNPFMITSQIVYILPLRSGFNDLRKLEPHLDQFFPYGHPEIYQPPSLKHMCRHFVRSRLHDNWCLPYSLWKLPIPHEMRCYLNYSNPQSE